MMIRALIKNGVLKPLDPLPPEWRDGRTVEITGDVASEEDSEGLDEWYHELEQAIAIDPMTPDDVRQLEAALAEADRLAKEQVRREMGLP
jgi:hypothetical protein